MNLNLISEHFFAGRYTQVIETTGKYLHPPTQKDFHSITSYQVGSLVFLGDLKEAQQIFYNASKHKPIDEFLIFCRFYLGVGYVRYSQFTQAAHFFSRNLLLAHRSRQLDHLSLFYAHQGAAFFNLAKGEFQHSLRHAEKSYLAAFEARSPYGEVLALELLAISHCQVGKIRTGLHEFEKALSLVKKIGNGGIETALRVSWLRYRSFYGIDLQNGEQELRDALTQLQPQDTYSKAELVLELARQLMLRGRTSQAQLMLDQMSDLIYKHQNKKQTALFNHRYAHILYLKGETLGALSLLRMAVLHIDPKFDAGIHRQLQGFIKKLSLEPHRFSSTINFPDSRIQRREGATSLPEVIKAEDPMGDLLDALAQNGPAHITELKRLGLIGLIPRALKVSSSSPQIILGPERGQLVIIKSGDVMCVDSGITMPMRGLVKLLAGQSFRGKEYLVQKTWGYTYDPYTHDKLLYATIAKLRNKLGAFASLLEWSHEGYRMDVAVLDPFLNDLSVIVRKDSSTEIFIGRKRTMSTQLNLRQIKALKLFETGTVMDVTSYAKRFKVCTMTACRDLSHLSKSGLVTKVGRARATKYLGEKFL